MRGFNKAQEPSEDTVPLTAATGILLPVHLRAILLHQLPVHDHQSRIPVDVQGKTHSKSTYVTTSETVKFIICFAEYTIQHSLNIIWFHSNLTFR